MRMLLGCIALLGVCAFAPSLYAQESAVDAKLEELVEVMGNRGYRLDQTFRGYADDDSWTHWDVSLSDGIYVIAGVCDDDCTDMNLFLEFQDEQRSVLWDDKPDALPIIGEFEVDVINAWSIRATMRACAVNPCYIGVAVFER